ncbi:MAG: putative ABC transporter permease [Firmicutes bacterium]|jgi:uncharacterized membrane protein|nr:putative ABC transporter permease [Bacillota bacterium]
MIVFILRYLFLFITGGIMGWLLEVFYRRYFGAARKWINPGFLSGPFLPLYGSGVCLLYIVSDFNIALGFKIVLFTIITTLIEYITGLFFLKYYKTRLWDYSNLKFNVQGIIAPLYSFFWTILSLFFYYILYPYFYLQIEFLYGHLELSLFVGIVLGILFVDMTNSFDILNRLKAFAEEREEKVVIDYEQLKLEIRERIYSLNDRMEQFGDGFAEKVEQLSDVLEDRVKGVRNPFRGRRPTFLRPFNGGFELLTQLKMHVRNKRSKDKKVD